MGTIAAEISRINAAKSKIRTKTVALGLTDSSANIDVLATAISSIADNGTVNANVQEGESYTILAGYYHGGTVNGISGGGSYTLQEKSVTPTKSAQSITSDSGYYGLSAVNVGAIPTAYQDTSGVTAIASDVLLNKVIVTADGTAVAGTMANNGAVTGSIDGLTTTEFTIVKGYHDGTGKVSLTSDIADALALI